jgi:hypothetical protein
MLGSGTPCSDKVTSALTQLAGEGRSKEVFLAAVHDMVSGMTKLCGPTAPPSASLTLQQVRQTSFRDDYCALLSRPCITTLVYILGVKGLLSFKLYYYSNTSGTDVHRMGRY